MQTVELFAGPGGMDEAARLLGVDLGIIGVETNVDACATARAAGHQRIQTDVTGLDPRDFPDATGLIVTPPCFPAGTPVLTVRGVVPIEDVVVGDRVLTHRNRWREVTHLKRRVAAVYDDGPLSATADHPFFARRQSHARVDGRRVWSLSEPDWTPAAELRGKFLAIPEQPEHVSVPAIPGRRVERGATFWYMVGRWLGDGWLRLKQPVGASAATRVAYSAEPRDCHCGRPALPHARYPHLWSAYCSHACAKAASVARRGASRAEVVICCGPHEAEALASNLADTGIAWTRAEQRTTVRFTASHKGLAEWLRDHFGQGAARKTLPAWALTMGAEDRASLLDGYLDADGHAESAGWAATTVSHCLAVALRLLATSLGYTTSLGRQERARAACIEGRKVNERPAYRLQIKHDDGRYTRRADGHRWVKQRRELTFRGYEKVYDFSVADDESFVAHGFVVHNCPPFSDSGKRLGLGDDYQHVLDAITALGDPECGIDCGCYRLGDLQDPRSRLVIETARWALNMPSVTWLAAEQVPAVEYMWEDLAAELAAAGWESFDVFTIDASDYGAGARRKRTFLIGRKYLPSRQSVYPPADMPRPSMAHVLGWEPGHRVRTRNNRRPTGGNLFDADGPSWCLTGKARTWERDADGLRLTAAEAGALQGFPRDYPWQGSRTSQFQQAGDVVSPLVGAAVLGTVLDIPWKDAVRRRSTELAAGPAPCIDGQYALL